jgi:hypothetical protein
VDDLHKLISALRKQFNRCVIDLVRVDIPQGKETILHHFVKDVAPIARGNLEQFIYSREGCTSSQF